jgi:putative oxidoreductase
MNSRHTLPRGEIVALARIMLGAVFLWLGTAKAIDPVGFLKLVRQFDLLRAPLALNAVAAILPWFEIFCGALLVLGIKPRATALVQLILLAAFTTVVALRAVALYRSGAGPFCALRFDCGCGNGEVLICLKLLENGALALLAALVASVRGHKLSLWPDDFAR